MDDSKDRLAFEVGGPRLAGKRAVITGASSGIGAAVAGLFAREGARLHLIAAPPDAQDLASVSARVGATSSVVDFADAPATQAAFAAAVDSLEHVDILINNAGFAYVQDVVELSTERWQRLMSVNLQSVFLLSRSFARHATSTGRSGAIVNTSSSNAIAPEPGLAAYNASKAAVSSLTQTMALEFAAIGLRVNSVLPGMTRTRQTTDLIDNQEFGPRYMQSIPLGRYALPEDIAPAYLFLASDDARYMTGASITVDGGLTVGLRWPESDASYANDEWDRRV